MREYWVEFHGYCIVQADDRESVEWKFYKEIMPSTDSETYNCVYSADKIEMIEPLAVQLSMFDEET